MARVPYWLTEDWVATFFLTDGTKVEVRGHATWYRIRAWCEKALENGLWATPSGEVGENGGDFYHASLLIKKFELRRAAVEEREVYQAADQWSKAEQCRA